MPNYFVIVDGKVDNVAVADAPLDASWVLSDGIHGVGCLYNNGVLSRPPEPEALPEVPKPYLHFIDLGPFNDRFGAKKLAVLMSSDAIVKAFNSDKSDRRWIDLERLDVRAAVFYMAGVPLTVAPGQTVTMASPILTVEEATAIMDTPVSSAEQLGLVKAYFS
jgi:hypothetical protein